MELIINKSQKLSVLKQIFRGERGSASIEFSLLAIPLFLPIFLFLHQFAGLSSDESIARTLARESVRAFILSSHDEAARSVAGQVIQAGGAQLGLSDEEISHINLTFYCSKSPCLSPDGLVRARVEITSRNGKRMVVASAQEYVSPWK